MVTERVDDVTDLVSKIYFEGGCKPEDILKNLLSNYISLVHTHNSKEISEEGKRLLLYYHDLI